MSADHPSAIQLAKRGSIRDPKMEGQSGKFAVKFVRNSQSKKPQNSR